MIGSALIMRSYIYWQQTIFSQIAPRKLKVNTLKKETKKFTVIGAWMSSRCFLQNKNFIKNIRNENISIKVLPITRDNFFPSLWQHMNSAS